MNLLLNPVSGISGDMTVAALIDLGVPVEYFMEEIYKLPIRNFEVKVERVNRYGLMGVDFSVFFGDGEEERNLRDIEGIIESSNLNQNVKEISKKIFRKLSEAEAKVHGKSAYEIHFHEVGAVDSICDIVGTAICLDYLKINEVWATAVPLGTGFVKCSHGIIPVPTPAVLELLKGFPTFLGTEEGELTTPTGAAIISTLVNRFVKNEGFKVQKIGHGFGKKTFSIPNLLRAILIEEENMKKEDIYVFECNIDDTTPQIMGHIMEKLFCENILDAWITPIIMKKGRPGFLLSVLVKENMIDKVQEVIFRETTTIGIRRYRVEREELEREIKVLNTDYGDLRVKESKFKGETVNVSYEFEDLKRISNQYGIPIKVLLNKIKE